MFRLSSKIILAFSIIIISGTIIMVSIINYTTRSGYKTFIEQNDIILADRLVTTLKDYYAQKQSWDGIERFIHRPKPGMAEMMGENRRRSMGFPPTLLTDADKNIVIDTRRTNNRKKVNVHGVPIKYKNKIVGYISTGFMIEKGLTKEEENFLGRIKLIIIFVSIFILAASIIFIYIFTKKITRPITELSIAAKDIEAGHYSTRVKVTGSDEISNLATSFNRMAGSIESNDKWRKQIIADSAHELRTPVTLIQGNLELILEGVYKADKSHLKSIYDETLTLSRLIKELQELSSAESGSMYLRITNINLNILIENSLEIFLPEAKKKYIKINNFVKSDLPEINGDFQKLKQVFSNILTNAFRHTPEMGNIQIKSEIFKKSIIIRISDSGSGIPKDELEKIFERFYRTDSSRNRVTGGSGLGLSICREIIRLHSGTIHAESNNESGATIVITLPYGS